MTVSQVYQCGQLFQPSDDYFVVQGFTISRSNELFMFVQERTSLRTIGLKWGLTNSGFTCYGYNDTSAYFGVTRLHSMSFSYDYRFMFYQTNQTAPVYMAPLGGMDYVPGYLFQVISLTTPIPYLISNATLAAGQAFATLSTTVHGYTGVVTRRSRIVDDGSSIPVKYFEVILYDHNGYIVSRIFLYSYETLGVTTTTDVPTFVHLSSFGDLFVILSSGTILRVACRTVS